MAETQQLNRQSPQHANAGPQSAGGASGAAANMLAPPVFQLQADPVQKQENEVAVAAFVPGEDERIANSVGMGGDNNENDVKIVQYYLIQRGYLPETLEDGTSRINGVCDEDTIFAIRQIQTQVVEASNLDARVDPNGSIEQALLGEITSDRQALSATDGFIGQVEQAFPNGINVAIWANYTNQSSNNQEFERAADKYASAYNSVGFDSSGTLQLGVSRPITNEAEIINTINDIHNLLVAEHRAANPDYVGDPPAFTKIKTLALFAHGMPWGMHMSSGGNYNLRIDTEDDEQEFEMFVRAIKGPLKDDVDVALMACNAGRESDGTEPGREGVWGLNTAEQNDGDTSFAARFAEELGGDASVYAHLSRGHTVNNYSARVFGADAGRDASEDQSGVHIFRLLYPESFVASEAARLEKDEEAVATRMWRHFRDRMTESHDGDFSVTEEDGTLREVNQLGADMFSDLEGTAAMLQADWQTWVVDNPVP